MKPSIGAGARRWAGLGLLVLALGVFSPGLEAQEIFEAAKAGDAARVRMLIDKDPGLVKAVNEKGRTALHFAAAKGHRDVAAILLDHNAPPGVLDDTEDTPLLAAAREGKWDIVELIVDRTPPVPTGVLNGPDFDGNTVLHLAGRSGQIESVKLLLAKGAATGLRNAIGQTAYNLADEGGFQDIVACLAAKGADRRPAEFPKLSGPYLGQPLPGRTPRLFAKGIVSTRAGMYGTIVFAPDGREAFWKPELAEALLFAKIENGRWTAPRAFPFTAKESIDAPFYSLDGRRLFFMAGSRGPQGRVDREEIWFVERAAAGWSEPKPYDPVVNAARMHWQFSMDRSGDLYLNSEGGICRARFEGGRYQAPEPLPAPINVKHSEEERYRVGEIGPFISPAGDYLIFAKFGGGGLVVSFRMSDGTWSEPRNLSERLQSGGNDSAAHVTPDGKYLFFQSVRKGSGALRGLYWVDAGIIEDLRPKRTE